MDEKEIKLLKQHISDMRFMKVVENKNYINNIMYEKYYYTEKANRQYHILKMMEDGWKYNERQSKQRENLYQDLNESEYILCAEFYKNIYK